MTTSVRIDAQGNQHSTDEQERQDYVFDSLWDKESERLRTNEAIWDPGTFERFEALGTSPGWHCLEIGAGSGSAARALAELVGPEGRVVAADLETVRLVADEQRGAFDVWELDLREDELPPDTFDLVHARMLVQHLPDREAVIAKLVSTLKPGGLLFLEDTDSSTLFRSASGEDFLQDVRAAGYGLMREAGHDPRGGHVDYHLALSSGLTDVSAEGRVVMVRGGSVQARHYQLWLEFMAPQIVAEGLVTRERIDEAIAEMGDPAHSWLSQVLISTVGRKPIQD
ncbi:class I SAM-dependent methyltransferase [Streptomyces beihaiensis]|uniref:Class I SAM-dependent methyltransferase n=1 Tax=Streptomyces beihaiensis TaxID=2984495 RepID=A0ABT3TTQ2_9ACTN|nr:class I SAM-dependent methyltransferase [Streptomyces beihaiensis]MCX3059911.1 class I SAM-dependent methyltransferase [Streptomyces beihaiensis]